MHSALEQLVDTLMEARAVTDVAGRAVTFADIDQASARHFGEGIGEELYEWFLAAGHLIAAGEDQGTVLALTGGHVADLVGAQIRRFLMATEYLACQLADLEGSSPDAVLRRMVEDLHG
jgi:hypothetical protein